MTILDHSDAAVFARAAALAALPDFVTGYFVMENGRFGGPYTFPRNKDKEEIHWPPNVVGVPPPIASVGKEAFWNGTVWDIRDDTAPVSYSDNPMPQPLPAPPNQQFLPMPQGVPQQDVNGNYPTTVLNEEGTAWVWKYPDVPTTVPDPVP